MTARLLSPILAPFLGAATEGAGRRERSIEFILYFLLVSAAISLATTAIRMREPGKIVREATRFLVTVVIGIILFSAVVFLLEWLFVRPLV